MKISSLRIGALASLAFLGMGYSHAQSPSCGSRVFTLNADFDAGILLNLNYNSPNNNQLQINPAGEVKPFPFVNIACSARGTAVRINVETGEIIGEYLTAPNGMGRDPSRTTVDKFGNVWVANRQEGGFSGGQNKGSITRIGLVLGGTRGDKNPDGSFTPNPSGEYLQGPFLYSTVADRDGDGLIRTSRGLGNILAWSNAGSADSHGGVSTASDEAIINYTRVTGTFARTVAVDANNDVWVGGLGDLDHEKISGVTGLPAPGTQFNFGAGGYGGLIDGNGVLWSARGGRGLMRFVPNPTPPPAGTATFFGTGRGDYGLAVDPLTGDIWHTRLEGNQVLKSDSNGNLLGTFPHGNYYAQGVAVDSKGNVWVAHSLFSGTTVGHLRTDGTYVGNVTLPGGNGPTGVAVDANGKVWVANINSHNAMRIDPDAGPIGGGGFRVGAVDMTVSLGAGASPYNYSDMTGAVLLGATTPSGSWTVIHDGGAAGTEWGKVAWTGETPAGTSIKVEVRSADVSTDLPGIAFEEVSNGADLCGLLTGRFIEVRATLSSTDNTVTPVLYDLTVSDCEAPVAACVPLLTNSGKPSSFKELVALDNCDPVDIDIYVADSASAFVAGPYAPGQRVVLARTLGAPSTQAGPSGSIVIRLNGDAETYAMDSDGNVGPVSICTIP